MDHKYKLFGSLVLAGSLLTPVVPAFAQEDHHDHDQDAYHDRDHDKDHDRHDNRYYDHSRREYHTWDSNEDTAYRRWLQENHHKYTDFGHQSPAQQQAYWNWRHDHPDHH